MGHIYLKIIAHFNEKKKKNLKKKGKEFSILRASLKRFKAHSSITILYIAHNLQGAIIHGLEASVNIHTVSQ